MEIISQSQHLFKRSISKLAHYLQDDTMGTQLKLYILENTQLLGVDIMKEISYNPVLINDVSFLVSVFLCFDFTSIDLMATM